jgi:propionate CoA-transferase
MNKKQGLERNSGSPLSGSSAAPSKPAGKVMSARQAVSLIKDGDTVATGGFVGIGFPEQIALELETLYLEQSRPRGLTLVYAAGQGDGGQRGLNHLGHEGLVAG